MPNLDIEQAVYAPPEGFTEEQTIKSMAAALAEVGVQNKMLNSLVSKLQRQLASMEKGHKWIIESAQREIDGADTLAKMYANALMYVLRVNDYGTKTTISFADLKEIVHERGLEVVSCEKTGDMTIEVLTKEEYEERIKSYGKEQNPGAPNN